MSSFTHLRSQARTLESQMDSFLSQYAAFNQSVTPNPSDDELAIIRNIEDNLKQREDTVAALKRSLDAEANQSATKMSQLERHKEILGEHRAEFKRIRATIQHERNRTNLLTSVQTDIESFRSRSITPGQEAEYMLNERGRIENTHSLADTLLSQAYETRDEFFRQRATLVGVQRRVLSAASHIPGLNTLISKVNTRKRRDSIIIASLIICCIMFIFFVR